MYFSEDVLRKMVLGKPLDRPIVENILYEMCDDLHGSDCILCPMYKHITPSGCPYHKNGSWIFDALKEKFETKIMDYKEVVEWILKQDGKYPPSKIMAAFSKLNTWMNVDHYAVIGRIQGEFDFSLFDTVFSLVDERGIPFF